MSRVSCRSYYASEEMIACRVHDTEHEQAGYICGQHSNLGTIRVTWAGVIAFYIRTDVPREASKPHNKGRKTKKQGMEQRQGAQLEFIGCPVLALS